VHEIGIPITEGRCQAFIAATLALHYSFYRSMVVTFLGLLLVIRTSMFEENNTKGSLYQPQCVVGTCNDSWDMANVVHGQNVESGGCASVRHSRKMEKLNPDITGQWCKVWLAVQRCDSRWYRYVKANPVEDRRFVTN